MFGYIKTVRSELRIREYEHYRASYCGLCRAMGKCTGQCSRMLLSYDFAFLANVRMLLDATKPTVRRRRCIAHPLRRRPMMEVNGQLRYCAAASAILAYEKCRDDVADERGFRRLAARVKCLFLRRMYRKGKKAAPGLADAVRAHLERLAECEARKVSSVDTVAAIFGDLLADVAAWGLEGDASRIARRIGFATGRFIYVMDALDDQEKDAKRGRFNPFLLLYGGVIPDADKQPLRDGLVAGLYELEAAFDLLPEGDASREILNNILYLGMPQVMDQVLRGGKRHNKEELREQQSL